MSEHIYEISLQKTTSAAAGPIATVVPAALAAAVSLAEIREIGIYNNDGTNAAEIALGIPAAAGSGAVTGATVQELAQFNPSGNTQLATSFATTQPTAPTNFYRRAEVQAIAGAGSIWVWGQGEFPLWQGGSAAGQVVIWQLSSLAVTYDVYLKVAE